MPNKNKENAHYLKYRREINNGDKINHEGYYLFPFKMKNVYIFDGLKYLLTLSKNDVVKMMGVKYIKIPYMTRLFKFDEDIVNEKGKEHCPYFFSGFLNILGISLGIYEEKSWITKNPFLIFEENDKIFLEYNCPITNQKKQISESDITEIREIIAVQNGHELPDLFENPELREQYEKLKKMDCKTEVYADIDTKINNVCWDLRIRRKDIEEWSIFEFDSMADVGIHREEYRTLATAEFKEKENPYVHPYYPSKPKEETYGLVDLNKVNTDGMANHV